MKKQVFLFFWITMVTAAACQPKVKTQIMYRDRIVYQESKSESPSVKLAPCDRGFDYSGASCDRSIEDHTFWLGHVLMKIKVRHPWHIFPVETEEKISVVYEFYPTSKEEGAAGAFRRAMYMTDPVSQRQYGYIQNGFVTGISHEKLGLRITNDTCSNETSLQSLYYVRRGDELKFTQNEPGMILEKIVLLPIFALIEILERSIDLISKQTAQSVFEETTSMKPYKFSLDLLPVTWGCSVDGDFSSTGPIRIFD